ncbi:ring finger domain protein [Sporothrix brasiliensis 5110]|uniref:Ring finger domain protein n=1 Tax=Sporothrix brasiliensis 5110 TaxID=1398154 RepID=A0A0C2IWZ0_9PEZI|nr:ring finger domain protein [Sporothrix brasiliensis 5110]KIH89562.1 ring finger domain protein [Sporothrix brasiliensis 5110]
MPSCCCNHVTDNLTVLLSKYTETQNGILQGLLYVPDLDPDDPCYVSESDYVPDSVVRQSNLPSTNFNLIALAPWYSVNCTQSYLASARYDPLRAFLFYLPTNDTSKPPDEDSDVWDLQDDGEWRLENHYPIFAVSGALGQEMMYQLSLYSGNLTDIPFGENISEIYNPDPDDYVRIWTELTVSTPTGLPNVWVFILAVIGVLLAVITLISLFMHFLWRRRRASLQRRVAVGEINLEAMGIKRLTVPPSHIQKFPLFTYNYDPPPPQSPPVSPTAETSLDAALDSEAITSSNSASDARSQSASDYSAPAVPAATAVPASPVAETISEAPIVGDLEYQPKCQICLEPHQNRVTIIRELSCGHIFHPECIDEFLAHVSSLCPLCKASMLPRGYSPRITNAMVRRERAIRRLRERVVVDDVNSPGDRSRIHSWSSSIMKHLHITTDRLSMSPSLGTITADRESAIELKNQSILRAHSIHQLPAMNTSEATRRRMARLAGIQLRDLEPQKDETSGNYHGIRRTT